MEIKDIEEMLIDDFDMQLTHIKDTLTQIEDYDNELREALEVFLNTRNIPEINIEGYNFELLMSDYGMNEIGSFMMLDWLKKEPEEAKLAIEYGI